MSEQKAVRRLVKSPPELWAQCSDPALLAKHLTGFGEIKITRLEPESTVAWEGESASGTVELEASGWGTRVRLTALQDPAPPAPAGSGVSVPVASAPLPAPRGLAARLGSLFGRRSEWVMASAEQPPAAVNAAGAAGGAVPAPSAAPGTPAALVADLEAALDSLGQAHHRPYSRG